jgi:hypothetical protein
MGMLMRRHYTPQPVVEVSAEQPETPVTAHSAVQEPISPETATEQPEAEATRPKKKKGE